MKTISSRNKATRLFLAVVGLVVLVVGFWVCGYMIGSKRQAAFDSYSTNLFVMYDSYLIADALNAGKYEDAAKCARTGMRVAYHSLEKSPLRGRAWRVPYIAWDKNDPFVLYWHEPSGVEARTKQVRQFLENMER
jgi:hypothetical protein